MPPLPHASGSFGPTSSRFGCLGNENTAGFGLEFDFIAESSFLKQGLRQTDTSGVPDSNDARFHMNVLMGLHCNHIRDRQLIGVST